MTTTTYKLTPSAENSVANTDLLAEGWDWPVAGCSTLAEYVHKIKLDTSRRFFWVHENDEVVGFFGFSLHPDFRSFQTGTFINPKHRSRGINNRIKRTAIAAFQAMGLPLIATVLEDNVRSVAAMRKVSGKDGDKFWEEYRQTNSYIFDLSDVHVDVKEIDLHLFHAMCSYAKDFRNVFASLEVPMLEAA